MIQELEFKSNYEPKEGEYIGDLYHLKLFPNDYDPETNPKTILAGEFDTDTVLEGVFKHACSILKKNGYTVDTLSEYDYMALVTAPASMQNGMSGTLQIVKTKRFFNTFREKNFCRIFGLQNNNNKRQPLS